MKTLEYYMKLPYQVKIEPDAVEGGYTAWIPDLPGCITTGETMPELMAAVQDAKKAWLEAALEDRFTIREPETKAH